MTTAEVFVPAFAAVLAANFASGWFIYAAWRIHRNENDWVAIGIALFILLIAGVTGYALRWPS